VILLVLSGRIALQKYCSHLGARDGAVGATSQKVAGSIRDLIHIILPAALWSWDRLKPLIEISTRNIPWEVKVGRWIVLTKLPPSCANYLEIWEPQPPGTLRACPGM